jgi:hypothetical protein
MDAERLYLASLEELERATIQFADAMLRAAGAAQLSDPRGDKPDHERAIKAFSVCRENLMLAFAKAPGFAQMFFPKEDK